MDKFTHLTDTPQARRKRQQKRRAKLKAIAQGLGFESWYKLETAVLNGAKLTVES